MSRARALLKGLAGGAVAAAVVGWVGVPQVTAAKAARDTLARETTTADELNDRLTCLHVARDRKAELAGELAAGRHPLPAVIDDYLLLDRLSEAVPFTAGTDPRLFAARSALVRAREYTRRLPEADRAAVRGRLLKAFAEEFPNHPLAEWP